MLLSSSSPLPCIKTFLIVSCFSHNFSTHPDRNLPSPKQFFIFALDQMMKSSWLLQLLILLVFLNISLAEQRGRDGDHTFSFFRFHVFFNRTQSHSHHRRFQDAQLRLSPPTVLSGVLCFIAASISSAGGIGGGGLFIPILTIIAGLDLKTASSFSAFMVTGGSVANVICNFLFIKSPKFGGKCLIDYDIALLSEPSMLLGVSIGVICNRVFPEWLITVLFAIFLAWCTFKTCRNGILCWRFESQEANIFEEYKNEAVRDEICDGAEQIESVKVPLLGSENNYEVGFPWMKIGILVLVWFSFFTVYLLRGNRNGQNIGSIKPCGLGYWMLSSLQIPLAMVFTAWILLRKQSLQYQDLSRQLDNETKSYNNLIAVYIINEPSQYTRIISATAESSLGEESTKSPFFLVKEMSSSSITGSPNKLLFPTMALLAGVLGGVFGIGGGMLISPLLLHVGIAPEVTAATCSFMVFFSSTMSALQYLLLGMDHTDTALIFSSICFIGSLVGLVVVQQAIRGSGRASLIIFSISIVMALSTVLITGFGAVDVWNDYVSGEYMGFKSPC